MAWSGLLDGELRVRASAAVARIARDLDRTLPDGSLARGDAGLALLYGYLEPDGAAVERHFDRALAAVAEQRLRPSLFRGFVGAGWVGAHLALLDPEDDTVDEAIAASLDAGGDDRALMNGLAGMLAHARERGPRPIARANARRIVDALEAGFDDWAGPGSLVGVAHGITGIAAAIAHGEPGARGGRLARAAVHRVLDRASELAAVPVFGWCHADVGVAAAVAGVAAALDDADLARTAVELARGAVRRHRDDGVVRDASFCHGAAGLGHLFNRVHQASGDPACADAARFWFGRALDLQGEVGVGGYRAWIAADRPQPHWCDEPGLLHGAAGVALALLAATTDREPRWDRAFGLS